MPHRAPPVFTPGPLSHSTAAALTQLARDVYSCLLGLFSAAPPLGVRQGEGGVNYYMDVAALADMIGITPGPTPTMAILVSDTLGQSFVTSDIRFIHQSGFSITPLGGGVTEIDFNPLTVKNSDNSSVATRVVVITARVSTGIQVEGTGPSSGTAVLGLRPASLTQSGMVVAGFIPGGGFYPPGQVLGAGTKTIAGNLLLKSGLADPNNGSLVQLFFDTGFSPNLAPDASAISVYVSAGMQTMAASIGGQVQWILDRTSFNLAGNATVVYSIRSTPGVTGTGNLVTATGGLVTAIASSGGGTNPPTKLNGGPLSATGTTQGTATSVTGDTHTVNVTDALQHGVILPTNGSFSRILIQASGLSLNVYPPVGGTIDGGAVNNPTVLTSQSKFFHSTTSDSLTWVSQTLP